ncbi:MAG: VWA domain-containing protein [Comamonas sp.]|jgi:magnesium chelatase subunit ChlD-like protein|nr:MULTISPECIES: VWA domain-containing protein [Comamonas]MDR3065935.1 VWA domain-containing protein [Comamonas sp.]MEB5964935.1 VWA domain-containing protein [Comamonas testosteroni]MPS93945.1 VWA domain-containing protein [Comamonas sp.]
MPGASLDWTATLRQRQGLPLAPEHLRWHQPEAAERRQHLFLLDSSASMVESGAFAQAKGLLLQWLRRAYLQRESVALLCFGAGQLQWLLEPTRAPRWNADLIEPLRGGGGTPLAQALHSGWQMAARYARQPSCLWLLSDFRSPDVLQLECRPAPAVAQILVDCETAADPTRRLFGGAERLATVWPDTLRLPLKPLP